MSEIVVLERIENLAELEDLINEAAAIGEVLRAALNRIQSFEIRIQTRKVEAANSNKDILASQEKA
jgi:hypothetical protein|nr:MAG TPA: hypothetical protein [Caudoviricetes sp.]